jgi:hypothetical protein
MRKRRRLRRQAGTGKASASESLLTCRNPKTTSEPGCFGDSGMSLADIRLLARWCPACRRREPGLRLPYGTGEGASRHWPVPVLGPSGREVPKRMNRKGLSTVAGRAGGPVRSSGDVPVTGAERRGRAPRHRARGRRTFCPPPGSAARPARPGGAGARLIGPARSLTRTRPMPPGQPCRGQTKG